MKFFISLTVGVVGLFLWLVISITNSTTHERQKFCAKYDMTIKEFHTGFLCVDKNGVTHDPDVMSKIK